MKWRIRGKKIVFLQRIERVCFVEINSIPNNITRTWETSLHPVVDHAFTWRPDVAIGLHKEERWKWVADDRMWRRKWTADDRMWTGCTGCSIQLGGGILQKQIWKLSNDDDVIRGFPQGSVLCRSSLLYVAYLQFLYRQFLYKLNINGVMILTHVSSIFKVDECPKRLWLLYTGIDGLLKRQHFESDIVAIGLYLKLILYFEQEANAEQK